MADTLRSPAPSPPLERLEPPPAAKRYRFLTDRRLAFLFISPALALLIFLSIWPLIRLIWLSFTDYSVTRDVPATFLGLDNYVDVITSPVTQKRALTTLIFVVGAVGLQTALGFAIAFLISRRERGRGALDDALPDPDDAVAGRRRPVLEVHARRPVRRRELVPRTASGSAAPNGSRSSASRCSR